VLLICIEYGLLRSAPLAGALSSDARLTSVCLSHTSGLSREQRGLGILNWHTAHGTHDSDTTFKVKGQLAGGGAYCGGLPYSLLCRRCRKWCFDFICL